jgi:hypothetical protein
MLIMLVGLGNYVEVLPAIREIKANHISAEILVGFMVRGATRHMFRD